MIELTPLGHACVLIEGRAGRLLCDPHFFEEYGQGLFVHDPPRRILPQQLPPLDLVFISHRHRDHFDVRSLAFLPRATPIACAADPEILYCLERLGFQHVRSVQDWQQLVVKDLQLTITPSLHRVPEHGLVARDDESCVWNMVDSVVDVNVIARVKTLSPVIDLLLWPYQPLLETAAVQNEAMEPSLPLLERKLMTLSLIAPRWTMPYADGQLGTGDAGWLNSYRFPADLEALRPAVEMASRVVDPRMGQKLQLRPDGLQLVPADIRVERSRRAVVPKAFDTTRAPGPLPSFETGPRPARLEDPLVAELTRLWQRVLSSEPHAAMVAAMTDWRAVYDFIVEIDGKETTIRFEAPKLTPSVLQGAAPRIVGRQGSLRVRGELLWEVLTGSLHYMSAFLGGAFRSWHCFYRVRRGAGLERPLLAGGGAPYGGVPHSPDELPAPAFLLNSMVASDPEIRLRVLDSELGGVHAA